MPPRHVKGQKDSLAVFQYVLTWSSRLLCLTSWLLNLLCNVYGQTLIDQYTVIQFSHHHSFLMCYCSDVDIMCSSMLIFLSTVVFIFGLSFQISNHNFQMCEEDQIFPYLFAQWSYFRADCPCCFSLSGIMSQAHLATDCGWLVSE